MFESRISAQPRGNEIFIQRLPNRRVPQAVSGIFEHSQGDPGRTEELVTYILCAQYPDWNPGRKDLFVKQVMRPISSLVRRPDRHIQDNVRTSSEEIELSIRKSYTKIQKTLQHIQQSRRKGEIVDWSWAVPELAKEIICRDWIYIVNDTDEEGNQIGRRRNPGLKQGDNYDPNKDSWMSYIAYYALWKDKNGKRRSTGLEAFDKMYAAIGNYLEQATSNDLGLDESYRGNYEFTYRQEIKEKLMEMLAEYNERQKELGFPEHCVWEEEVNDYFGTEGGIGVV